ncbi:DeoR/GlpR family DNA-binding transcription regulator [Streptomyces gobiensis]|uniref:DeoR/GlpR family DNA-binding transcription regulator n=1 Tax=Streptomyces gobiensis TaxID=2875706 RepID=UPI001E614F7F|nr:DeoR/GlpR family DNA-binding transcription regulator [Streptomyces gobiensis]UGY94432.1 DeoR/GlpR family DNA-binding transcription regulator [Streptomyces gobiensis]
MDTSTPGGAGRVPRSDEQRDRRQYIRDRVSGEGFVRAADLAGQFGVSLMTIHRDLDALQSQGWLRKVRGGATALSSTVFHGNVSERMAAMADTKKRLADAALSLIAPGQAIMLDDSTTCLYLAERLTERTPLTVITNFFPVIKLLAGESGISLVALGGTYFPAYDAFLGLHTAEAVASFRADTLFMSTTAITRGRCYHQSQETVHVKRALIDSAARRVLLADHTKFTREGLHTLAPLTAFDIVLTDSGLPAEEQRRIRDLGVTLKVVGRA